MEKAWQRQLKEQKAAIYGTEEIKDIKTAEIKETTREIAKEIIYQYEWLGGLGNATSYYGIFWGTSCEGIVCFGFPSASGSREKRHPLDSVVGNGYGKHVVQLVRGACSHLAHKHSASKLISQACKLYSIKDQSAKIIMAYADERAGEIGTVYQACNWLYIGKTNPRNRDSHYIINNKCYDARDAAKIFGSVSKETLDKIDKNWTTIKRTPKHQYLFWVGDKKEYKLWLKNIAVLPYPKRNEGMVVEKYINHKKHQESRQLYLV